MKRIGLWLIGLALAVLASMALSFFFAFRSNTTERPLQSERMMYLLFPKRPECALARAIFVDGGELCGDAPFQYFDGEESKTVARSEVTLKPPVSAEEREKYVAKLNAEIARWGEKTDFRRFELRVNEPERIHLRVHFGSGKAVGFFYAVKSDLTAAECREETVY